MDGKTPCQTGNAEDWFAPAGTERALAAKQACFQSCPMLHQCAEYAIRVGVPNGIWGGVDEKERGRIWKANMGRPTQFQDELDAALSGVSFRSAA